MMAFDIDCVVIGLNASATLSKCLNSVRESHYLNGKVRIIYVDCGSLDNSVLIARSVPDVEVIETFPEFPTPGAARNVGANYGEAPFIQFLDSDTCVDPEWLTRGISSFGSSIGAVRGLRREMFPEQSFFNWIGDREWNEPSGECEEIGGDVLIRREVIEQTKGYDAELVGGEDPELSVRVRKLGWKIVQVSHLMTKHDLAMTSWRQYWRRSYRTGYAYLAVADCSSTVLSRFWESPLCRMWVRAGLGLLLGALALQGLYSSSFWFILLVPAFALIAYPRIRSVSALQKEKELSLEEARLYAWHCSVVVIPQFFGAIRYLFGKICGRPMRNKRKKLETRVSR